jgi:ankyrin repeat protein
MPLTFNPFRSTRRVAPSSNADEQKESLLSPEDRNFNIQEGAVGSFFSRAQTSPKQMPNGQSDFLIACRYYYKDAIDALISDGVDVNQKTPEGETALHLASSCNNPQLTMRLIEAGANLDLFTKDKETALHIASKLNNHEIVSLLLAAGADVNAKQRYNLPPVFIACLHNNAEIAKTLFEAGADTTCLGKKSPSLIRHLNSLLNDTQHTTYRDLILMKQTYGLPPINEETDAIIATITDEAQIAKRNAYLTAFKQVRSYCGENIANSQKTKTNTNDNEIKPPNNLAPIGASSEFNQNQKDEKEGGRG